MGRPPSARSGSVRGGRAGPRRALLRGRQDRLPAGVLRPGGGDRLAARRYRRRFPLPRRARLLARRADRRPARQRLLGPAVWLGARPDLREHPRGRDRGAAAAAPSSARLAARQSARRRRNRRLGGDRRSRQRDRRRDLAALGRGDRRSRHRDRLAHMVARRCHRRAARRAARAGLVPAAAEGLAPRALARGCRAPDGRRRAGRLRLAKLDPGHVPGLPAADLGRASLRAARRNARRRHHRGLHRLERDALPRPVPLRVGHAQRAQHAALHRRRSALDAKPGRGRQRARALRIAARRFPGARDLGFRRCAAPARARPA